MNHDTLTQLQKKLEAEKQRLEGELGEIATKDKTIKDNWKAKHPDTEWKSMDEKGDDSEDYNNRISLEQNLELKLRDVTVALEKMKGGTYGTCGQCGKEIEEERLMAYPEAKTCLAHQE